MKDTLVIFGSHPDTRGGFDWKRQDCDVWVFNEALSKGEWVQWAQAVFQMHVPTIWKNPNNRNDSKHYQWLVSNQHIPIYMLDHYPEIPQSVAYPLDEVVRGLFGGLTKPPSQAWSDRGGYFTSSVAYALALGIYYGYKRIELWGVELALNTEYVYQRPGVFLLIGLALGRGIEVLVTGTMLDAPLYGYEGDIYIDKRLFTERAERLEAEASEYEMTYAVNRDDALHAIGIYAEKQMTEAEIMPVLQRRMASSAGYARIKGAIEENRRYLQKAAEMEAAGEGDFRFSRAEFEQTIGRARMGIQQLGMEEAVQRVRIDEAFNAIDKADGYKKRLKAVEVFGVTFETLLQIQIQISKLQGAAGENERYVHILDEQYKAAGGEKSVEVLSGSH